MECEHGWRNAADCDTCTRARVLPSADARIAELEATLRELVTAVRHHIEELDELHDLIERGPDWHCIKDIRVTLLRKDGEQPMTLETAESQ